MTASEIYGVHLLDAKEFYYMEFGPGLSSQLAVDRIRSILIARNKLNYVDRTTQHSIITLAEAERLGLACICISLNPHVKKTTSVKADPRASLDTLWG